MRIGFVLLSFGEDEPAGMERSVAALLDGLTELGHQAFIIAAGPSRTADRPAVIRLRSLDLPRPAVDDDIAALCNSSQMKLKAELACTVADYQLEVLCWVDALWGLGFLSRLDGDLRSVLMVHILKPTQWLYAALAARHDTVIVPSEDVLSTAKLNGFECKGWKVVPNGLLEPAARLSKQERETLRLHGPVRVVARLGAEKGVLPLLRSKPANFGRGVDVVLGRAAFESSRGYQDSLLLECREASLLAGIKLYPPLRWREVPTFFAQASVGIIPSLAESFGLVALESLSVGTPIVAFPVGNLPKLARGCAIFAETSQGAEALWSGVSSLLNDPLLYHRLSRRGISRSRQFQAREVASKWLKAIQ